MVVILGSASKSQRDCGTVRRRSGGGRGSTGIDSSCLSTISRSVNVMQHNKSVQALVSVCGQVPRVRKKQNSVRAERVSEGHS